MKSIRLDSIIWKKNCKCYLNYIINTIFNHFFFFLHILHYKKCYSIIPNNFFFQINSYPNTHILEEQKWQLVKGWQTWHCYFPLYSFLKLIFPDIFHESLQVLLDVNYRLFRPNFEQERYSILSCDGNLWASANRVFWLYKYGRIFLADHQVSHR